jgi:hypothetical protein
MAVDAVAGTPTFSVLGSSSLEDAVYAAQHLSKSAVGKSNALHPDSSVHQHKHPIAVAVLRDQASSTWHAAYIGKLASYEKDGIQNPYISVKEVGTSEFWTRRLVSATKTHPDVHAVVAGDSWVDLSSSPISSIPTDSAAMVALAKEAVR